MEKKADLEYKALVKLGIPDSLAYLMACNKYGINKDEVENIILDVKEQQIDFQKEIQNMIPLDQNIKLISNPKLNDKNEV